MPDQDTNSSYPNISFTPDRYWSEMIEKDGIEAGLECAIGRIEFFEANTRLEPKSEGWAHLRLTADLISCVLDAMQRLEDARGV